MNFNKTGQSIELVPSHFTANGLSTKLISEIEAIDPNYRVKGREPVAVNVITKKKLKVRVARSMSYDDVHAMFKAVGEPKELTFFDVLRDIFPGD